MAVDCILKNPLSFTRLRIVPFSGAVQMNESKHNVCEKVGAIHQQYISIYLSYDPTFHDMEKEENFLRIMTTHPKTLCNILLELWEFRKAASFM